MCQLPLVVCTKPKCRIQVISLPICSLKYKIRKENCMKLQKKINTKELLKAQERIQVCPELMKLEGAAAISLIFLVFVLLVSTATSFAR